MSLRLLQTFASLLREGDRTGKRRRVLMEEHRNDVLVRQEEFLSHLTVVDRNLRATPRLLGRKYFSALKPRAITPKPFQGWAGSGTFIPSPQDLSRVSRVLQLLA